MTKAMIESAIRSEIFSMLNTEGFTKINDRQYGILVQDANGDERYVRVGVIVSELREDMTAAELMQSEVEEYEIKQKNKAEKAKAKAEKIARDAAKRAEKAAKEEEAD